MNAQGTYELFLVFMGAFMGERYLLEKVIYYKILKIRKTILFVWLFSYTKLQYLEPNIYKKPCVFKETCLSNLPDIHILAHRKKGSFLLLPISILLSISEHFSAMLIARRHLYDRDIY